jgi:hypothetical protein
LLNGERGLDALSDSELLIDLVDWREPDATMPKLPKRELASIGSGFAHTPIKSATLKESKMCARINQQGPALRAVVVARHSLHQRNHHGICLAVGPVSVPRKEAD